MINNRKPFFKENSDISTRKKKWTISSNTWSAIKALTAFKIEKRNEKSTGENPIYLFTILIFSGFLNGFIIWVLLIGTGIDDKRTWFLFILVYFVYGVVSTIFTHIYLVPLATSKLIYLAGVILLLFLTNYVAWLLGFSAMK